MTPTRLLRQLEVLALRSRLKYIDWAGRLDELLERWMGKKSDHKTWSAWDKVRTAADKLRDARGEVNYALDDMFDLPYSGKKILGKARTKREFRQLAFDFPRDFEEQLDELYDLCEEYEEQLLDQLDEDDVRDWNKAWDRFSKANLALEFAHDALVSALEGIFGYGAFDDYTRDDDYDNDMEDYDEDDEDDEDDDLTEADLDQMARDIMAKEEETIRCARGKRRSSGSSGRLKKSSSRSESVAAAVGEYLRRHHLNPSTEQEFMDIARQLIAEGILPPSEAEICALGEEYARNRGKRWSDYYTPVSSTPDTTPLKDHPMIREIIHDDPLYLQHNQRLTDALKNDSELQTRIQSILNDSFMLEHDKKSSIHNILKDRSGRRGNIDPDLIAINPFPFLDDVGEYYLDDDEIDF